jgi:hypothetical protein
MVSGLTNYIICIYCFAMIDYMSFPYYFDYRLPLPLQVAIIKQAVKPDYCNNYGLINNSLQLALLRESNPFINPYLSTYLSPFINPYPYLNPYLSPGPWLYS